MLLNECFLKNKNVHMQTNTGELLKFKVPSPKTKFL